VLDGASKKSHVAIGWDIVSQIAWSIAIAGSVDGSWYLCTGSDMSERTRLSSDRSRSQNTRAEGSCRHTFDEALRSNAAASSRPATPESTGRSLRVQPAATSVLEGLAMVSRLAASRSGGGRTPAGKQSRGGIRETQRIPRKLKEVASEHGRVDTPHALPRWRSGASPLPCSFCSEWISWRHSADAEPIPRAAIS